MRLSSAAATAVILLLAAPPAGATDVAWDWMSDRRLGSDLAAIEDLDGDGVRDLIVGQSGASDPNGAGASHGRIFLVSGKTGDVIRSVFGPDNQRGMGARVARIGDVTGDDIPDVLAAGPGDGNNTRPPGIVYIFSSADLSLHCSTAGFSNTGLFGSGLDAVGDITGDDVPDFVVGEPGFAVGPGVVRAYSGADCMQIPGYPTWSGDGGIDALGSCVAGLQDVDFDNVPDFAIGAKRAEPQGRDFQGEVRIISGQDGDEILRLAGPDRSSFGTACANVGDVNGDGVDDLGVGAPTAGNKLNGPFGGGEVFVFSGATSKKLFSAKGLTDSEGFGSEVAGAGDLNGDGLGEVLAGAPFGGVQASGEFAVLSGNKGARLLTYTGMIPFGQLGTSLAGLGGMADDDVPDIAAGAPVTNPSAVYAFALAQLGPPTRLKWQATLVRPAGQEDEAWSGSVAFDQFGPKQRVKIAAKKLGPGQPSLFVEDDVGTGTFDEVVDLEVKDPAKGGTSKLDLQSESGAPAPLPVANLTDLVDRRIEIRTAVGVVLEGLVPPPGAQPNLKLQADAEDNGLKAKLKAIFSGKKGTSKIDLKVSGLDKNLVYDVWLESGPGGGSFDLVGQIVKGKFQRDTKKGDPLPGSVDRLDELLGRAIQVRQGATVLIEIVIPAIP